jgi:hypothetical protein
MHDDRVCPVCREIDGYTWIFEVGKDELNGVLTHPTYGIVWDSQVGSLAHGHRGNCRCHITYEVNLDDLLQKVMAIHQIVLEMVTPPE